ncbi:hypothetical protein, partial [Nonomuraea zeae]
APAHSRVAAPVPSGPSLPPDSSAAPGSAGATVGGDPAEQVAIGFRVSTSQVAAAPLSPAMRRITRPGSRLMRALPFSAGRPPEALVPRMDDEPDSVTAAAPKETPAAVVTSEQLDAVLHPVPPQAEGPAGGAVAGSARVVLDPVDGLPRSPDFVLRPIGDPVAPTPGANDSPEALRYKAALRELYQGLGVATAVGRAEPRRRLQVDDATASVLAGLGADHTVPKNLLESVDLPERLRPFADRFIEAMAYPVFDLPTYQALLDLGVDAFVPNLSLLPANSITLLENNREFIESYLAGLNHEMARELLWREYPTDQRGTPFRQFWDPGAALPVPGETPQQRRERGYDIPPMHTWPLDGLLGGNGNRPPAVGPRKNDLVLAIRGELLKKYPTAAVYAHKAAWPTGNDGLPDLTKERTLADVPDGAVPARDRIRLPLYEAKIEPDIYLLGFDLDAEEAIGSPPDDAGWFFVLKERPGDPRFGLDDGPPAPVEVWNDLSWEDVDPHHHGFIELDPGTTVPLAAFDGSEDDQEKQEQRGEDENLPLWYSGLSSADLAYILFQVPVLVAVHAQEMLPR